MILVDQPRWPAHGTLFSHLVSDSSLDELHAFAALVGLPVRAFDHDHYDVPAKRYTDCVRAGAIELSGAELVKRLVASGLRVRSPDRAPKRERVTGPLRAAWSELLPGRETLADELLNRWSETHRHYHDARHLAFVLDRLDELCVRSRPVQLAAWFHDAVYDGVAGQDEERSARLAEGLLADALPGEEVAEVARLVRLTATHNPSPGDEAGAALSDADLAILATAPARYDMYVRDVRADYEHVPDETWHVRRAAFLDGLLKRQELYETPYGRANWAERARDNLAREHARWANRH